MKESEDRLIGRDRILAVAPSGGESMRYEQSAEGLQDDSVIRALEEYRAALEAGHKPNRDDFLARYPERAQSLAECLDGLEFVHQAAPQLSHPAVVDPAAPAVEIQPEGPLGDFRIVPEFGRGGMGVDYEAVQISLGRRVELYYVLLCAVYDAM